VTALELRGGLVLDPAAETFRPGIVHLAAGRVTDRPVPGARVVDVTGCHVTPGLVDLHTHVFGGQDLGVPADEVGPASGTTPSSTRAAPAGTCSTRSAAPASTPPPYGSARW